MTQITLVQTASPDSESPAERLLRVENTLREHAGAELYVLPETWGTGYFSFEQYAERAESLGGPTVAMVRDVARDLSAAVHLGSIIERGAASKMYNTSVLIDASGRIAQIYRKIHVFGYQSRETELLTPGNNLSVVDSSIGRISSITCYDLRFPGLWQELSARGAEVVILPSAWPAARLEHWRVLTQARAIEHQMHVIAVNAVGVQQGVALGGHSRVIDPTGVVVAECGAGDEVLTVNIDPAQVTKARIEFPVLTDRLATYSTLASDSGAET